MECQYGSEPGFGDVLLGDAFVLAAALALVHHVVHYAEHVVLVLVLFYVLFVFLGVMIVVTVVVHWVVAHVPRLPVALLHIAAMDIASLLGSVGHLVDLAGVVHLVGVPMEFSDVALVGVNVGVVVDVMSLRVLVEATAAIGDSVVVGVGDVSLGGIVGVLSVCSHVDSNKILFKFNKSNLLILICFIHITF